jgi:type IV secretory pathway VirJ component
VKPELERLRGKNILCFCGRDDGDAICKNLIPGLVKVTLIDGGHRIGKNYQTIVNQTLKEVR